jgi:hypothetical protein
MAITISLRPETEQKLRQYAAESGYTLEGFVQQLVERLCRGADGGQVVQHGQTKDHLHAGMTFDEILAPVRRGFQESQMSDEDVDALFSEALERVRQEKRSKSPQ